jgi:hypothetical protein
VGLLSNAVDCNTLRAFLVRNDGAVVDRSALLPYVIAPVAEPPLALLLSVAVVAIAVSRRLG